MSEKESIIKEMEKNAKIILDSNEKIYACQVDFYLKGQGSMPGNCESILNKNEIMLYSTMLGFVESMKQDGYKYIVVDTLIKDITNKISKEKNKYKIPLLIKKLQNNNLEHDFDIPKTIDKDSYEYELYLIFKDAYTYGKNTYYLIKDDNLKILNVIKNYLNLNYIINIQEQKYFKLINISEPVSRLDENLSKKRKKLIQKRTNNKKYKIHPVVID